MNTPQMETDQVSASVPGRKVKNKAKQTNKSQKPNTDPSQSMICKINNGCVSILDISEG